MTWEQFKLKLDNKYLVATNNGVQHNDRDRLWTFLTKSIKADFIKEVISAIEVNLLVMEPYFFENPMVGFKTNAKKQDRG